MLRILLLFTAVIAASALAQESDTIELRTPAETQQLLARGESLLANAQSHRAYELLSPYEAALAGNAYYDYLLGVAALDSGRTSEAIFSLRRAIAVEPRYSGARMELARAYYEAGNTALARPLFAGLLEEHPPPRVRGVLHRYIAAIDNRQATPQSRFVGYLEAFAGHDSNANGSTGNQQFLGFTLSPENLATESPFAEIGAGFDWMLPRTSQYGWIISARAGHRKNPDAAFVDSTLLNGVLGMNWQRGAFFGRAGVESYWATRDGNANESYAGLNLQFGRRLGDNWELTLGLRGGAQRFDGTLAILDVNRGLYIVGVSRRFTSLGRITIEAIGGSDNEQQSNSPYGNSKAGGRLSLRAPLGNIALLHVSVGSLTTDYDGLFFGGTREDRQFTSLLQIEFRDVLTDGLSFIPRVRYVDNESDLTLYDYDRTEIGLLLRWAPR